MSAIGLQPPTNLHRILNPFPTGHSRSCGHTHISAAAPHLWFQRNHAMQATMCGTPGKGGQATALALLGEGVTRVRMKARQNTDSFLLLCYTIELLYSTFIWHAVKSLTGSLTACLISEAVLFFGVRITLGVFWYICGIQAGYSRCPAHLKTTPLGWVWLFCVELFGGIMFLFTLIQPFDRLFPRTQGMAPHSGRVQHPVLLIHGYMCNAAYWLPTRWFLASRGVENVYTISVGPVFGSIDGFSKQVDEKVRQMVKETGCQKVIIVGHSMGGLIARNFVQFLKGRDKVAKIITVGCPNNGTALSRKNDQLFSFFHAICLKQMYLDSDFLKKLNRAEAAGSGVPVTNIFSYHDEVVVPQESSILDLPHVKNMPMGGVPHLAMPFFPSINKLILSELVD